MRLIDAVEVVQCEECVHRPDCNRRIVISDMDEEKRVMTIRTELLEYCSHGERKTECG